MSDPTEETMAAWKFWAFIVCTAAFFLAIYFHGSR